jgi:hypothetical protein
MAIIPMQVMIIPVENKMLTINEVYPSTSIFPTYFLKRIIPPKMKLISASRKPKKVTNRRGIADEKSMILIVVKIKPGNLYLLIDD